VSDTSLDQPRAAKLPLRCKQLNLYGRTANPSQIPTTFAPRPPQRRRHIKGHKLFKHNVRWQIGPSDTQRPYASLAWLALQYRCYGKLNAERRRINTRPGSQAACSPAVSTPWHSQSIAAVQQVVARDGKRAERWDMSPSQKQSQPDEPVMTDHVIRIPARTGRGRHNSVQLSTPERTRVGLTGWSWEITRLDDEQTNATGRVHQSECSM